MDIFLAFIIGGLYAAGLYLMMRRSLVRVIIGLSLLGHAANLLIFTLGRLVRGQPPLVAAGSTAPTGVYADPVPQALILTAIVIGFGVQAFAVVLIKRAYRVAGTDDMNRLNASDET
jgi:multicomponent Na+:H+ antiporter subunit C